MIRQALIECVAINASPLDKRKLVAERCATWGIVHSFRDCRCSFGRPWLEKEKRLSGGRASPESLAIRRRGGVCKGSEAFRVGHRTVGLRSP